MNRLLAIVGPTGVGKSRLALHLASLFHGEIVSADSRQVYRYLDIGTDKPLPAELSRVPHHLIDIINPDEDFNLACYQHLAYQAIEEIQRRNRLPLLVGGSGLYVWAVLEGWQIPAVSPDPEFRHNLEKKAADNGTEELYRELVGIDPEAAKTIDRRNVRRVIRALEVYRKTESQFSRLGYKNTPGYDTFIIGLTADRAEIYRRIDRRIDAMIERGLATEVEKLLEMGYDFNLSAMSGIGYRQIVRYLKGGLTLEAAKQQIKSETHRLVRQQYSWFRLNDTRIHWFDIQRQEFSEIEQTLEEFLKDNRN